MSEIHDYTREVCALLKSTCNQIRDEAHRGNCELALELLLRWSESTDARLIDNLAHSRVLVHDLLESQKRLIGTVSCALELAQVPPQKDDMRWIEYSSLAQKTIAAAVQVP